MYVDIFYFSDKIVGVDVSVLGSYVPFTYLFVVALQYKTGTEVENYSPTLYSWCFFKYLHLNCVIVNTSSPLLNHTFEAAARYQYHLWISNAVSTVYTMGRFTGYCYYILLSI